MGHVIQPDVEIKLEITNILSNLSLEIQNNKKTPSNSNISDTMHYIWIDQNINEEKFQILNFSKFKDENECSKCKTIEEGIKELFGLKYEETTIIISGKFFPDFCKKFDEKIKEVKILIFPIVIVFCYQKEKFISNLKINNNYENNYLLNKKLIFNIFDDLVDYKNGKKEESEDLTFDEIKNIKELIIPCFYSYLIQDVTKTEIDYYNQNIISNYNDTNKEKEKEIKRIVKHLKRINSISKEKIIEYWLKIYTMESNFYSRLNKTLRTKNERQFLYHPLIKLCYEGIRKKFLLAVSEKKLYRGTLISKKELDKLKKKFEENKKEREEKNNKEFPKVIVYSRSFLSFSEEEKVAKQFLKRNPEDKNTEKVMYEIEEINNKNIDINTLSNCSLKNISEVESEEEVLVFPLSCFEIIGIEKIEENYNENNKEQYFKIYLKYLGRYGNPIREQLGDKFFREMKCTKFANDLIEEQLTMNKDFVSSWIIKQKFKNKYNNLCFILDNKRDFVIRTNNSISIYNLDSLEEENKILNINICDKIEIVSLIKLDGDKICFSTSNNFIQIIKLVLNNNKFKIKFQTHLDFCAYNLLYIHGERSLEKKSMDKIGNYSVLNDNKQTENDVDKIMFTNNNCIYCIYNLNGDKCLELWVKEDNHIIVMKELPNSHIIYLTEDNKNHTFINFFDLINKAKNMIKIQNKFNNSNNIVILKNYCIIGFDKIIYLIDFEAKKEITSLYLDNILTNIIKFNDDKLMIGLYDENKNISIIRELYIECKNNISNPYIIGEGKIDDENDDNIKKILEINYSYILVNTQKGKLIKFKKKNYANEIF